MSDLISVIIPAFNSAHTLDACLSSVLEQTYGNLEIIIIDDGSTDNSKEICDQYASAHTRIRAFHQQNRGPSAARNVGLRAAQGQYIAFVDSDDELHPDYFKTLLEMLVRYEADVSAISYQIVAQDKAASLVRENTKTLIFDSKEAVSDLLYQKHLDSSQCCKLYRRAIIDGMTFPEDIRVYEDLEFVYHVFCQCKRITWTDKKMYYYHKQSSGQMDSLSPITGDAFMVMERIGQDLYHRFPHLTKAIENRTISVSFNILKLLSQSQRHNETTARICWQNIKALRLSNFLDPNVRLKNKLGIVLSIFGLHALSRTFSLCAGKNYRSQQ